MNRNGFCKNCFNLFTRKVPGQKYCSEKCEHEYFDTHKKKKITLDVEDEKEEIKKCRYCNQDIIPIINLRYYCNNRCKSNHEKNIPLGEIVPRYCLFCKKQFIPENEISRFCSVECRNAKQNKIKGNKH